MCGPSRSTRPQPRNRAILRQLADRTHVTLRIYNRLVDHAEQHRIIQNANRRNRLLASAGMNIQEMVDAEHNLKDVKQLLTNLRTNGETLLHTAVFIELKAADMDKLRELQSDVMMELTRCKISVDRLTSASWMGSFRGALWVQSLWQPVRAGAPRQLCAISTPLITAANRSPRLLPGEG